MATGPRYRVPFRRRRECRTDYHVRRRLLTARETRAVIRRSNRNITVQFADFGMEGDRVGVTASTRDLVRLGWAGSCSNLPAAYLVGYLAGKRALAAGIGYAVPDIGMQRPQRGGVLFAAIKGMLDAGLEVPCSEEVLPVEDRLLGRHIDASIEAAVSGLKEKMEAE